MKHAGEPLRSLHTPLRPSLLLIYLGPALFVFRASFCLSCLPCQIAVSHIAQHTYTLYELLLFWP